MTSTLKLAVLLALALVFAAPASAEQSMTKGTKNYQSAKPEKTQDQPAATEQTDPSKVEPAAGGDMDQAKQDEGKSFKEEMRLPRKN